MATYAFNKVLTLVTGAGNGIGRAAAKAFADAGANVVASDIDFESVKQLVKDINGKGDHMPIKCDVSDEHSIKHLADSINAKYKKPPTVVIHSAGIVIAHNRDCIFDIKLNDWNRVIDVNQTGTFLINQTFGRLMRDQKIENGAIVNLTSVASRVTLPFYADYAASKASVDSLTKNFGVELAPYNIRVNAVGPAGVVPTLMFAQLPKHIQKLILDRTPAHRYGLPEEVANLCLFLASPESSYINGQTVFISGGQ